MPKIVAAKGSDSKFTQVKTADSNTVYYLDRVHKMKKAYLSQEVFLSYGNKPNDIKIISRNELDKWPDVRLVKTAHSSRIYYIKNGKKALIKNMADFQSFGFKATDIVKINIRDMNGYALTDYDGIGLTDRPAGGGDYSARPSLLVGKEDDKQKDNYLPTGTNGNLLATFTFFSPDSRTEIKKLTINTRGLYDPWYLNNIKIVDEKDNIYDVPVSTVNKDLVFNFNGSPLTIDKGRKLKLRVYLGVDDYAVSNNHTIYLSIEDKNNIITENNTDISGNFPVRGKEYRLIRSNGIFGEIAAQKIRLESEVSIGNNKKLIGKFKLAETSGNENILIERITLLNRGNADNHDLKNITLRDERNKLISKAEIKDRKLSFNINGYKLNKNSSVVFSIFSDITDGDNHDINMQISEVEAKGADNGYGLKSKISNVDDNLKISRKSLNLISKEFSRNNKVFANKKGMILGSYQLRNNDKKIILKETTVIVQKNNSTTTPEKNIYLVNSDTGEIFDQKIGNRFNFGNFDLLPKKELNFAVITDSPDDYRNGDTYQTIVEKIDFKSESGYLFSDKLNIRSKPIILNRSGLYVYPDNAGKDAVLIKGQKNVKIADFVLETSAGDDLKISSVSFAKGSEAQDAVTYPNGFDNLKVYLNGKKIRLEDEKNYSETIMADNINYTLKSGNRVELSVYADIQEDSKADAVQLMILNIAADSAATGLPAEISGLNTNSKKIILGGSKVELKMTGGGKVYSDTENNTVAEFNIKNDGDEKVRLSNISLTTDGDGFSNSIGYKNLAVKDKNRTLGAVSRPVAGSNKIGLNNYSIDPGQTAELRIAIDADDTVRSGTVSVYLSDLEVKGQNSNIRISANNTASVNTIIDGTPNNNLHKLGWPTGSKRINYKFHDPKYPFKSTAEHDGLDIEASQGTKVMAAASGIVETVKEGGIGEYSYVKIRHNDSIATLYGHLSSFMVKQGETVKKGQLIGLSGGKVGTPGAGIYSTGPHLHFGVIEKGDPVDPQKFLK